MKKYYYRLSISPPFFEYMDWHLESDKKYSKRELKALFKKCYKEAINKIEDNTQYVAQESIAESAVELMMLMLLDHL